MFQIKNRTLLFLKIKTFLVIPVSLFRIEACIDDVAGGIYDEYVAVGMKQRQSFLSQNLILATIVTLL